VYILHSKARRQAAKLLNLFCERLSIFCACLRQRVPFGASRLRQSVRLSSADFAIVIQTRHPVCSYMRSFESIFQLSHQIKLPLLK
jgi:hypothetical protein